MKELQNKKEEEVPPLPPEQLELYREVLLWLFKYTAGSVVIVGILLGVMEYFDVRVLTILMLVVLAGALGALFSSLTRLYSLRQLPAALIFAKSERPRDKYLLVFCLVPPIVGMIGAAFFYVFMQSEIISSAIFVNFDCNGLDESKALGGLLSYSPCDPRDYAKAIVWGFVSGFSERLVPNTLAQLENSGNMNDT